MRVLRFAALASCASSLGKGPIGVKMVDVAGDGAALVVDSYADAAVLVDVVRCAVLGVRLLDAGARGTGVIVAAATGSAFFTASGGNGRAAAPRPAAAGRRGVAPRRRPPVPRRAARRAHPLPPFAGSTRRTSARAGRAGTGTRASSRVGTGPSPAARARSTASRPSPSRAKAWRT